MLRRIFSSLAGILSVILVSPSFAKDLSCANLLSPRYGELRPDFVHTPNYDVSIDDNSIKNQCSTSHCHMYAWEVELERASGIDISNHYLDAMRLLEQTQVALIKRTSNLSLGSYSFESRHSIRNYGVVPQSAWKGRTDFISSSYYSRLSQTLESFLIQKIKKIKGETDPDRIKAIEDQAYEELVAILSNMIGPFPESFEFEGRTYTPRSFAVKFFPELYEPVIVVNMGTKALGVERESSMTRTTLKMDFYKAELLLRQVIDSDRPAHLSYRHKNQFVDNATGVMSIDGFAYPEGAGELTAEEMKDYAAWGGAHSVLVVGYELDPTTGRVRKWKIQNSWGEKSGDNGYFHMYHDYFEKFAWAFSFSSSVLKNISESKLGYKLSP